MIDDPVERIVQINKIKFKIKSENEEREKLKKIEIEKEERETEKEFQTTKDLLNATRIKISEIDEKLVLTKKEIQIRKKIETKIKKLNQTYLDQLKRKVLDELVSRDQIKLTKDEERKILGNRIKDNFLLESPQSDTITYFAHRNKIQDSKNYRSTISSNYNIIINKRKKKELEKNGINCLDSEIHDLWELFIKLKYVKSKKDIHNLKDAKLEWINIKLSAKNISRKESLDEAEQSLECMEKKKELAKYRNTTYEQIDKKYDCDEVIHEIKMEIMNNRIVDSKIERVSEEEKINRKREKASESQQYFSHK